MRYLDGLRLARRRRHLDMPSDLQLKQFGAPPPAPPHSYTAAATALAERLGRPPSFIESPFPTRAEYEGYMTTV